MIQQQTTLKVFDNLGVKTVQSIKVFVGLKKTGIIRRHYNSFYPKTKKAKKNFKGKINTCRY